VHDWTQRYWKMVEQLSESNNMLMTNLANIHQDDNPSQDLSPSTQHKIAAVSFLPSTRVSSSTLLHKNTSKSASMHDDFMHISDQAQCYITSEGHIVNPTQNWAAVTGITLNPATSNYMSALICEDHQKNFFARLKQIKLSGERERLRCQFNVDGTYKWFELLIGETPQKDSSGNVLYGLIVRSIEREIQTERTLRTATIEMEMAQKGRYDFLKHMSHELRTPLNAILGFAEMMEHGVYGEIETPEYKEYLNNINGSGQLLLHRINDMIEMVSIGTGDGTIEEDHVHVSDWFEDAKKLCRHETFCNNITVTTPEMLPRLIIKGDRIKLTRALGNIISNAARFSKPGSEVLIECGISMNGELGVRVVDSGSGIANGQLKKLQDTLAHFDSLFSQDPEAVGVGLGLTIAKEFVMLHDGFLSIDSHQGQGTSVCISLPSLRVVSLESPRQRKKNRQFETVSI